MFHRVIWSDAMLLQPQHFQQQERFLLQQIYRMMSAVKNYYWGFSQLQLQPELLRIGKIGLTKAHGIFRDGTSFEIPENDINPEPITINANDIGKRVVLAIPHFQPNSPEISLQKTNATYRYIASQQNILNNIIASSEMATIQCAQLAPQLLIEEAIATNLLTLPIAKITGIGHNNLIQLDQNYIPPIISLSAHDAMRQLIDVFTGSLVLAVSANLKTAQIKIILARAICELENFEQSPVDLYHKIRRLLIELTTLSGDDIARVANCYDHNNIINSFNNLIDKIAYYLGKFNDQRYRSIELIKQNEHVWFAEIPNNLSEKHVDYFVAIHAPKINKSAIDHIPNLLKIASLLQIDDLIKRALPGIRTIHCQSTVRGLPQFPDLYYFKLDKQNHFWDQISETGVIAIHYPQNFAELTIKLWAVCEN